LVEKAIFPAKVKMTQRDSTLSTGDERGERKKKKKRAAMSSVIEVLSSTASEKVLNDFKIWMNEICAIKKYVF